MLAARIVASVRNGLQMRAHYSRWWRRVTLACVGGVSIGFAILLQFSNLGIDNLRTAATVELLVLFGLIVSPALTMIGLQLDREARQRRRRLQAN